MNNTLRIVRIAYNVLSGSNRLESIMSTRSTLRNGLVSYFDHGSCMKTCMLARYLKKEDTHGQTTRTRR